VETRIFQSPYSLWLYAGPIYKAKLISRRFKIFFKSCITFPKNPRQQRSSSCGMSTDLTLYSTLYREFSQMYCYTGCCISMQGYRFWSSPRRTHLLCISIEISIIGYIPSCAV
jgi:hypothetical protein